uniref:Exocyst complex component 7 n=1 Tax=Triatoma infestans TaxID=30076 RepID=A0A161M714_TRIIF
MFYLYVFQALLLSLNVGKRKAL